MTLKIWVKYNTALKSNKVPTFGHKVPVPNESTLCFQIIVNYKVGIENLNTFGCKIVTKADVVYKVVPKKSLNGSVLNKPKKYLL